MEENVAYDKPALNKSISVDNFKNHYWLKKELVGFCVEYGISSLGLKMEIAERIITFLSTGRKLVPKQGAPKPFEEPDIDYHKGPFSRATPITSKLKRTRVVREFFLQEIGPHFAFNVRLNQFFRDNVGKTFQAAIDDYLEDLEERAQPGYKSKIVPQCQYNQFIRDFLADNKELGFKDAVTAWNAIKDKKGNHVYQSKNEK